MKTWITWIVILVCVAGVGVAAAAWMLRGGGEAAAYRTAAVQRGELLVTIGATGTVEPEEVIDVGAQVAGQILSFGTDAAGKTVDYGSAIEEGTVLARIDDSLYRAAAAEATAQVQSAQAGEARAKADLEQFKANLYQAERDWQRAEKLGPSEALAQTSYDAYKAAYEAAKANVAVGEAAILQARAAVAQTQAGLDRAKRNLGYTVITSPVRGVIIDRRVNIGQTVVASLNAPSLFLIAKDLKHMQVWVAVNEADVGKIHAGQPVTFTVDAFPGETFTGQVGKVRLNASMTQNVVTYTVEVATDNSSLRLLPYLTANVKFELSRREGVLLVPNAALRWTPTAEQVAPQFRQARGGPAARNGGGEAQAAQTPRPERPRDANSPAGAGKRAGGAGSPRTSRGVLWTADGKFVRPVRVTVGASDGTMTEVTGEGLTERLEVVTGVQAATSRAAGGGEVNNPFAPPRFGRGSKRGSGSGSGGGSGSGRGGPPPPP